MRYPSGSPWERCQLSYKAIVAAWAAENLAVLRLLQPLVMGMLGKNPESDVESASGASVSNGAGA